MYQKFLAALCLITLHIIANAQRNGVFNVRDFGARGDGMHLDSHAINIAILSAEKAGGGLVLIPSGKYLCGSIHLQSHITLELAEGSQIIGAPAKMEAYDHAENFAFPQYQDGGHTFFHNSLIWGEGLTDISIIGQGMINGGGLTARDKDYTAPPQGGAVGTGDKAIALKLCRNVLIRDITIFHGGHFAILVTGCDRLTLDHLTIDTNRDGIDLDGCTNAVVSNCDVNSPNDDAICPKSSFALNRPVMTQNLVITHCIVSGYKEGTLLDGTRIPQRPNWSSGRIKFGTESNGGFRDCIVSDCIFRNCNGLALEEVDGGIMQNIMVTNLTMEDVLHYPIYVTLGNRNRGPKETAHNGVLRNIYISNVVATNVDSMSGIQITGIPGDRVENIHLRNIDLSFKGGGTREAGQKIFPELGSQYPEPSLLGENPAYGIYIRHAKDIQLTNIKLDTQKPDYRPAIICNDIDGLAFDGFKARVAPGIPPYVFKDVGRLSVVNAPFFKGVDSKGNLEK